MPTIERKSRPSIRSIATAALACAVISPGGPIWAQEGESAAFGELVQVNVVNVDVVVTDKKGVPIEGLTAADFRLFEDGREVDIEHFTFVRGPVSSAVSLATQSDRPATSLEMPGREIAVPGEHVWLAILVDSLHTRVLERNRALRQLQEMVGDRLLGEDRVLVASYDRSLTIDQPFTVDRQAVTSTLAAIAERPAGADWHDRERRRLVQEVQRVDTPKEAAEIVRPWASQVRNELWGTLSAVEELVDRMAGLPGRRYILHVSSGLPANPGAVPFKAIEYKWPGLFGVHELMLFDQTEALRKLGAHASASGVVLHTFDAAGVRAPRSGAVDGEVNRVPTMSANNDLDERINVQMPLRLLADITGGRAILNRNDALPALVQLAGELHTYYSLGFSPQRAGDDRYHRLKVKVARKGARLRYREGYRDRTAGARMAERLRAALAHGIEDNTLDVEMTVRAAVGEGSERLWVPLQVSVPIRNLGREPAERGFNCRLRVYLAVMDDEGRMSDVLEVPVSFSIGEEEVEAALAAHWRMSRQLKMRRGRQRLAVAIRDEVTQVAALTTRGLDLSDRGSQVDG